MNNNFTPSLEDAVAFATMLHVGLPPGEAILYFADPDLASDPSALVEMKNIWLNDKKVAKQISLLQGGDWEQLSLDQRIQVALEKNYAEKAYFLYSHNFTEVSGSELSKLQEARKVLEAKMAGTSGKLDPLQQFYDDIKSGKMKLGESRGIASAEVPRLH